MAMIKYNSVGLSEYDDEPLHIDMVMSEVDVKIFNILGRDCLEIPISLSQLEQLLIVKSYKSYINGCSFFYINERIKDYVEKTNHCERYPEYWL